jgi:hypothetical protein
MHSVAFVWGNTQPAAAPGTGQAVEVWIDGAWQAGMLRGCRLTDDDSALAEVLLTGRSDAAIVWVPFAYLRRPTASRRPSVPAQRAATDRHGQGRTPGQPTGAAGRHRAKPTVSPDDGGRYQPADTPTARLPLSRIAVPSASAPVSGKSVRS